MPSRPSAHVFSVPPGRPFLDCVAAALLRGDLPAPGGRAPAPLELPDVTLILPTRRATRAVQDAFLKAGGGRAMLLPKIVAIGEGDDDLALLSDLTRPVGEGDAADIPPQMNELERRLTLTLLVRRWSLVQQAALSSDGQGSSGARGATPAQAAALAADLARLMDMVETEGKSLAGLLQLVPQDFSEHWQRTLEFLEIVTQQWPLVLEARGLMTAAARRNAVIRAEAQRLAREAPRSPVIVAGVTGSIPATVELMRAVASLPNGAIVLPALDPHLDAASWGTISAVDGESGHPEHPQFGLAKLIAALGLTRDAISPLPGTEATPEHVRREKLIAEAMRPSATTARWRDVIRDGKAQRVREALAGVSLVEAASPQDEAEAVALILREALETPGKTAALVSPDRLLARRVAVRLEAWGIKVDDSAGRPFGKTVPGAFLDLIVEAAASGFQPSALIALLKHPLTRLGLNPYEVRRAAQALEIAAFRTPYLGEGLTGIDAALERARMNVLPGGPARAHRAVRRLHEDAWSGARAVVARFTEAVAPLAEVYGAGPAPLAAFVAAHADAAERLARLPEVPAEAESGATSGLWSGEAGQAAQTMLAGLMAQELPEIEIEPQDYADLYRNLVGAETVRTRVAVHPRLSIWGPFEARLQQADVVVLGSLNEGVWPKSADPGPWLNRPMRQALGLPQPEEAIGQAAHDFTTLLGAPEVILTRAEKADGVPTVPSRWLMRIRALLKGFEAEDALEPEAPWLEWAANRSVVAPVPAARRPEPRPALALRPRKLSVSRVEKWIANPYAIFAREILGLEKLDALGIAPGPALRGSIIHDALARFSHDHPESLPPDPCAALLAAAERVLDDYRAHPRIAAFWIPRLRRFAEWFAETEPARRDGVDLVVAETSGSLTIAAPAGPFTLTARADRIDVGAASLTITDYKTGQLPNAKEVLACEAPQLVLEAAIALSRADESGFDEVPKLPVSLLRFIRASGAEPPGKALDVKCDDISALAREALAGLTRHVALFDDPATPYAALRRPSFSYKFDEFAHLARVAEWSSGDGSGGEEAA